MTRKTRMMAFTLGALLAGSVSTVALAQGGPMSGRMQMRQAAMARFDQIDTNHDKVLSPAEVKAYEAAQIKGLDANGDGFLTADEIAAKMTQMAAQRVTQHADMMVKRLDKNGDGKVSVEEFATARTPMDGFVQRMLKAGGGKISKATFDTVMAMRGDMGRGGWMQHRWGQRGGHQGWGDHRGMRGDMHRQGDHGWGGRPGMQGARGDMGPGMMRAGMMGPRQMPTFAQLDANGDGFITAAEIHDYRLAQAKTLDTNHDGFISPAEFAAHAMARMEPHIKTRAASLVKRLDLNNDGKLSIEELAAAPMGMMFAHMPTDKAGNITQQAFLRGMHGPRGGWHHHGGPGRDGQMPPMPPAPPADGN